MSIRITADEARELLTRAVEEKGEGYVYNPGPRHERNCVYFEGDEPSCILGHVLAFKGISAVSVMGADNETAFEDLVESTGVIDADPTTLAALAAAQTAQDVGLDWATAMSRAIAVLDGEAES